MFVSHIFSMNSRWRLLAVLLAIGAMPMSASAQTTSDLFEKAVYADETAGDLDEAIELYGQVIAKTKVANSLAAEAQYRLGLCFEKQDKPKEARDAFQAVVDDFPQEAKFVTLAKKHLPGALELLPVPWKDGEQLHFTMTMPNGMEIGKQVASIDSAQLDGKSVWRCSNRVLITLNAGNSFSETFCDKKTFTPLQSYWTHSLLGAADAQYAEGRATIDITGRDDPLTIDLTNPAFEIAVAYDNEQGIQLFRRLPLKVGMHTELAIVSTLVGNVIPLEFDVSKKEAITTPAGTFDCFKMELNIGQTFWISDDADRYLVRFAAGGISADLTRVENRKFDESLELKDKQFRLTLPGGWFAFEPKSDDDDDDDDDDKRVVHLLDRRANALVTLNAKVKNSLSEEQQASVEAWVESTSKKNGKYLKNYKIRDEGISVTKIGGQDAATVVFDYQEKKRLMTSYTVAVFGKQSAVGLQFKMPTDKYEALRGEFDTVVQTLRVK